MYVTQYCARCRAKRYVPNRHLLRVNNKNTGARCEICSKFAIKTPERRHKMAEHTLKILVFKACLKNPGMFAHFLTSCMEGSTFVFFI